MVDFSMLGGALVPSVAFIVGLRDDVRKRDQLLDNLDNLWLALTHDIGMCWKAMKKWRVASRDSRGSLPLDHQ